MLRRHALRLSALLACPPCPAGAPGVSAAAQCAHDAFPPASPASGPQPGRRPLRTSAQPPRAAWPLADRQPEGGAACEQQRRAFIGEGIPAKHHQERRLLGYSQQQLYDVVAAVEHYKEFVPWCQRSTVLLTRPPDFVEAELEVGFKMFVERYTSQVYLTAPSKVLSKVSDSTLFDHLDTTWEFRAGPTPASTWLHFSVDFAFKSPLYRHIAGVFFDEVVKRMMGAFEQRCQTLYGKSALAQRRRMQA